MVEPRELIARYIDEQAAWRRQMAERYPDDARNPSSAEHLDALARHVRALDANDGRLRQLWVLDSGSAAGTVWSPGPYTARAIYQYGFHGTPPPPDAFMDTLASIAEDDARLTCGLPRIAERRIGLQPVAYGGPMHPGCSRRQQHNPAVAVGVDSCSLAFRRRKCRAGHVLTAFLPVKHCQRSMVIWQYFGSSSMAYATRPRHSAPIRVVPEPTKLSYTASPGRR